MRIDPNRRTIEIERRDLTRPESTYVSRCRADEFSQFGEDGVIRKIFEIIDEGSRWCVEFGAWDGKHLSNTHALMRKGWSGTFIEGNSERFRDLQGTYAGNPRANLICEMVDFDPDRNSLDCLLKRTPIPERFDLLSIDIDGNDWHVWESVKHFRPRVVIIEFNPSAPNDVIFVQERDFTLNLGCSLLALIKLGLKKGYELVAVTANNALFVVREEFPAFGIRDNSISAMYLDVQSARIWQGMNSELITAGLTLFWRGCQNVPSDALQAVPREEIRYGDALGARLKAQASA